MCRYRLATILLVTNACTTCSHRLPSSGSSSECLLLAQNGSGVIGMDGTSSTPLDATHSLFVFGDTFLGSFDSSGNRNIQGALDNTGAIVSNDDAESCFSGRSFIGGSTPTHALTPPAAATPANRTWPGWGLVSDGGLSLFFSEVVTDPDAGFGFDLVDTGIATGSADPLQIGADNASTLPGAQPGLGAALLVENGFAYVYRCASGSFFDGGWFPCVVARTPVAQLPSPDSYQYFVAGQGYVGTFEQATVVGEGAPDFTITHNAFLNAYLLIYVEPFDTQVSARTAPAPEGPFSPKVPLHPCTLPSGDSNAFCYAGKEHAQLDSDGGRVLAITYNTNTAFGSLPNEPTVYWPRLFHLDLSTVSLP